MSTSQAVKVGQIWADNDWRVAGRTIRVDATDATHATCTTITNADEVQAWLDDPSTRPGWVKFRDNRGNVTKIRLDRFRPTTTGYQLIKDAEESR